MARTHRRVGLAGPLHRQISSWKSIAAAIMGGAFGAVLLALAPVPAVMAQSTVSRQESVATSAPKPAPADAVRAVQASIGRAATPAEVKAWDIDVRPDFKGLPPGEGDVALGEEVWEAKCASCHGVFGESNEVFTPIVGGTTAEDIKSGRVDSLAHGGNPHRTTLMKLSKLSTLWDYINRAMPWDKPKSLKTDEVYGLVAYILSLGYIVADDFTLSDKNMASTQELLPNRNGKETFTGLWETGGKPDVEAKACMNDCAAGDVEVVELPPAARSTHGNIAEQVRLVGPVRGTETQEAGDGSDAAARIAAEKAVGQKMAAAGAAAAAAAPAAAPAARATGDSAAGDGAALMKANGCTSCHGITNKVIGPGFQEIGRKYDGKDDVVPYLVGKMMKGSQGVWGPIPMPANAQLKESDARTIAAWIAGGVR